MIMAPRLRKLALAAHIALTVGWIGAVAGYIALDVTAATGQDARTLRGVYLAMGLIAWYVIVPLGLASLLTGLVMSLGTNWGLFRYYWTLISLLLTVIATVVLLVETQTIGYFAAPEGARVLEVGCGPGHLSIRLARQHGLHTTALDLDPAMIERARANADRAGEGFGRLPPGSLPSFLVGDVASLPFPDGSFDLVVSTMSMHHWADPAAGLAEIARVLRPGARALVWVFRPGYVPLHGKLPDPVEHTRGTPLRMVSATPWRWPWRFSLTGASSSHAPVNNAGRHRRRVGG